MFQTQRHKDTKKTPLLDRQVRARSILQTVFILWVSCVFVLRSSGQEKVEAPSYAKVYEIFAKNCMSCHNPKEMKGELNLESYETLMKGGETGPAIVSGKPAESLLLQQIEHKAKPFMPPPKKAKKLGDTDIALIRAWIET